MNEQRRLRVVPDDAAVAIAQALTTQAAAIEKKLDALTSASTPNIPRWAWTIVTPIIVAAILGLFGLVLNTSARLATIEAGVIELRSRPIPPPEVLFRLGDHERRLDNLEMTR